MNASDVLKRRARSIETIGPDQTVQEAIDKLCEQKIGSLLVVDGDGKMVGIITERDILKGSYSRSPRPENVPVKERMTPDPVFASPDTSLPEMFDTMTDKRIRHLPVMDGDKLLGLLSIGDLVAVQRDEFRKENHHLKDYIEQSGGVAP